MELKLPTRTPKQNNSLHKYLELLAEELNENGITLQLLLSKVPAISCTKENLKDELWRKFQKGLFGINSTRNISTVQTKEIYEETNKFVGENFGVHIPWPAEEEEGIPIPAES